MIVMVSSATPHSAAAGVFAKDVLIAMGRAALPQISDQVIPDAGALGAATWR
jgi:hypothetical protein